MRCAVAAFAKTPGLSPVKTRLAAEIGNRLAETFYRMSVEAVEELLLCLRDWPENAITPFWALAEINGASQSIWGKLPALWTGDGELGRRLFNVSGILFENYESVIMTGTDSPQLAPPVFHDAYSRINSVRDECVIGPSFDGGFYLFGSAFQIPEKIWTEVIYSREDTLEQLLFRLDECGIKYSFLQKMADADTFDDLKYIYASLRDAAEKNLPAQKSLLLWLEDLFAGKPG